MSLMSIGSNRKMGKKIGLFNLPAGVTCPGKTQECTTGCYALKAERCYPSAKASRKRNLEAAAQPDFAARVVAEVKAKGITKLRIHEAGDWFSQEYFDKWVDIIKQLPEVKFLAFTKSFMLDFSKAPANLVIYYSADSSTTMPVPTDRYKAHTLPKGRIKSLFAGVHTCTPVGKDHNMNRDKTHYNYCGDGCDYCWNNSGPVAWVRH